jgi:DNA-binding CsgD family transcriptional regulator
MHGRGKTGWRSLNPTEREIADHVADGLTNQAIGDRMYMSRHTVDFHLRHMFRKLDLTSRVELARLVIEQQLEGDD